MVHTIGSDTPFSLELSRKEVVVKLVSKVRDWKDSNLLLKELDVFAQRLCQQTSWRSLAFLPGQDRVLNKRVTI